MRFIHTSDFHLHPDAPERMDALRQVVSLANSESADALLIPGDLFDSPEVAGALRVQTRAILESFTGTTVITPGNHDLGAFPPKTDYGDRTILLTTTPYQEYTLRSSDGHEVALFGVPYQEKVTLGQLLAGLTIRDPSQAILLAHGTFEGSWPLTFADEGEEVAYLPIREADLRDRFAYAALGHLHSRVTFDDWQSKEAWGYAGSPVAVTRGEIGPRHAVLVDFEPGIGIRQLTPVRLATDYWETCFVRAAPWEPTDAVIERVRQELSGISAEHDQHRGLRVRVDGWTDGDEGEFRKRIEHEVHQVRAAHRVIECDVAVRTAAIIVSKHPELNDLLVRIRTLGAERGANEATVELAAGLLLEACEKGTA